MDNQQSDQQSRNIGKREEIKRVEHATKATNQVAENIVEEFISEVVTEIIKNNLKN